MLPVATFASEFLSGSGGAAAVMAIGVFLGQAKPALAGGDDAEVRQWATRGGIGGLCFVLGVLVLSSLIA